MEITLDEVNELLASPELESVQNRMAALTGESTLPLPSAMRIWAELSLSGMSKHDFLHIFREHAEELIALFEKIQKLPGLDQDEYAPGDEPFCNGGEGRVVRRLGFAHGFGLTYAIYFYFLSKGDSKSFMSFLKARKIPHAATFYRQLYRTFGTLRS